MKKKSTNKVAVLLSTYNGEKYIEAQIHSILEQLPPGSCIFIRDDGSTDKTLQIVQEIRDDRLSVTAGANIGFVKSFFFLMNEAPLNYDVYMLSDQDDIWGPKKIQRATDWLDENKKTPALYCSKLTLVDKNLNEIGISPDFPRGPSFENSLTENIVTGCTAAMNLPALLIAKKEGDIRKIRFHDWWIYLVIATFGKVHFDRTPTILYRQHGGNSIGMSSGWRRYWSIVKYLRRHNWMLYMFEQAENLLATHGSDLDTAKKNHINEKFNRKSKKAIMYLLFSTVRYRQTVFSDILFRALLAYEIFITRSLNN